MKEVKNRKELMDRMLQIEERKLRFVGAVMKNSICSNVHQFFMSIDVLPVIAYVIKQDLLYSIKLTAFCILTPVVRSCLPERVTPSISPQTQLLVGV